LACACRMEARRARTSTQSAPPVLLHSALAIGRAACCARTAQAASRRRSLLRPATGAACDPSVGSARTRVGRRLDYWGVSATRLRGADRSRRIAFSAVKRTYDADLLNTRAWCPLGCLPGCLPFGLTTRRQHQTGTPVPMLVLPRWWQPLFLSYRFKLRRMRTGQGQKSARLGSKGAGIASCADSGVKKQRNLDRRSRSRAGAAGERQRFGLMGGRISFPAQRFGMCAKGWVVVGYQAQLGRAAAAAPTAGKHLNCSGRPHAPRLPPPLGGSLSRRRWVAS
jgi:hypothetical protein